MTAISRARGFTLLEVLVALAVLAIAMTALVQAASQNTAHTHQLQERTLGHWVGANQLARYRAGLEPLATGTRSGRTELARRDWEWRAEIARYTPELPEETVPAPADTDRLRRVEIQVFPAEAGDEQPVARLEGVFAASANGETER